MTNMSDRDNESVSSSDLSSRDDDSVSVGGRSFSSDDSDEAMLRELASRPEEVHLDSVEAPPEVVYAAPAPPEPLEINDDVPIEEENVADSTINLATEIAASPTDQGPIPRNKSIAHWDIITNRAVFVSLDIETGGTYCGIIQLSAEIFVILNDEHDPTAEPTICHNNETFNEYINPGENALWDPQCSSIHGLHAQSPEITNADSIFPVWSRFADFIDRHFSDNDVGILVAYNGETCDLAALWQLTQAPRSTLSFPHQLKYFLDPYKVIDKYTRCPLHPSRSKLESLQLGCIWK